MSLEILKSDISSDKLRRIYYIYGSEDYLKKFYLNEIKRITVPKEAEDTDYYKTDGKQLTVEAFSEQLEKYPVISEKKMIVIIDLPFSSPVRNYIQKNPQDLPEDTVVVLYFTDEKYDERTKDFKTFKAAVEQNGLFVEINSPDTVTMKKWVNQLFRKKQRIISEDTVSYLLLNVDNDMNMLLGEINKLCAYCEKEITVKAIDAVCIKTTDAKTYELTDAVLNKDSDLSFKLVNKLFEMQTNIQVLLGALFSVFCNLYKIKLLLVQGLNADEISKKLNMRDFVVRKNIKKLQSIGEAKLCRIIDCCIEADLAAKSTAVDEKVIITKLIAEGINIL
jgi:DNA polymerase-3 subunit delta